jgi:hypothetical protein
MRLNLHVLPLLALLLGGALPALPEGALAQVPDTDIWVADLAISADSIRITRARNATCRPGYDNQPCFLPDGRGFLYAAADSAGGTDVYLFEFADGRVVRVTRTPESEYSPTPLSAPATGFCAVRVEADSTQRLWRFDDDGSNPRPVMAAVDSVGYFAWIDDARVAVFVLGNESRGEPHTLRVADVLTQRETVIARDIGRAIARVPGTRDLSYIARRADGNWGFFLLEQGRAEPRPLIGAVGEGQDAAWVDDTLLMARGAVVFAANPLRSDAWRQVADLSAAGIAAITRIAVSPTRDRIALVATAAAP